MAQVIELASEAVRTLIDSYTAQVKTLITPVANVDGYGAKGDNQTDNTQPFIDLVEYVNSKINDEGYFSNSQGNVSIFLPSGTYVVKQNAQLLSSTQLRVKGLNIKGSGRDITRIVFQPNADDTYLFYNNDKWLHVNFEDITFIGQYPTYSTNFMYSKSDGGAQNYTFSRCNFRNFNYGFLLTGSNNNSEFTFFHCGFYGTWNKVLHVPNTDSSDQFLNYNFFACQFEVSEGNFIDMYRGGNVNIWGGSFIHYGENGGTFFNFPYVSGHSYGTERFLCVGARFEHRVSTSKLIDCAWLSGTVAFISCDCSSQASQSGATDWITARFVSANVSMPSIKFDGCRLMGKHEYAYAVNSWSRPHSVVYENCVFTRVTKPSDFIVYTYYDTGNNYGGRPLITFRNCYSQADPTGSAAWNSDYGFDWPYNAQLTKKLLSITRATGGFPVNEGYVDCYLPLDAIITDIRLYSPAGAVTEGNDATFTVQTTETTPTVLATVTATVHSDGFDSDTPMFFRCDTEEKRHIQLVAGSNVEQTNWPALCLIEYIG
jgi:hypothetical protein